VVCIPAHGAGPTGRFDAWRIQPSYLLPISATLTNLSDCRASFAMALPLIVA